MSQAMDVGMPLRQACLNEDSSNETISCVLQHLQNKGLQTDVHFVPMSVNLYVLMRGLDIQVALFDQQHLSKILYFLGFEDMHMRDRSDKEYLKSQLLSNLSVNDLDEESIGILCQLYAVDAEMMQSIGLADVPLCSSVQTRHARLSYSRKHV